MKTLPAKNYTPLSGLNQLCLPMDVGVLIPHDDSVRLLVSKKAAAFRAESKANIKSEEGIRLRVNRSIQVEGAFGVTKENGRFRRFFTRGKAGVSCELFLVCMGYNVNKLHHKIQQGRRGTSPHPLKQKTS
jgi:hypothetical protein